MRLIGGSWWNWKMKCLGHYISYLRNHGGLVKFPLTGKEGKYPPLFKRNKKGRSKNLQATWPHLCTQQHDRTDFHGNHPLRNKEMLSASQHGITM